MTVRSEKFWKTFRWAAPIYVGIFVWFILWYLGKFSVAVSVGIAVVIAIADFFFLKWLLPHLLDR